MKRLTTTRREDIEWCDIWIARGAGTELPRALLIGEAMDRPDFHSPDGVHFAEAGQVALSNRVATAIQEGAPGVSSGSPANRA